MKRQASTQAISTRRKRAKASTSTTTVQAVVRKELRKKTDWKYTDVGSTAVPVYNTGTIASMYANLTRGDLGINNFEGNVVNPQALTFKYYAETAQPFNTIRVMLIQWFDAATPLLAGLLQSTSSGLAVIAPTLVTNKQYIKVLYDRTHMLAPSAADGGAIFGNGIMQPVTVYIPGKRLRNTRFNSGTNVVQDGNIYLLAVSDDAALGTVNLNYYSRITFSDS